MRVRSVAVTAAAVAVLVVSGCGGGGDAGGSPLADPFDTSELPLSYEERCAEGSDDTRGCIGSPPVPSGATLVDDDMTVQVLGSSFVNTATDDPVNTTGNRAAVFVKITNLRDRALSIDGYDYDLRFDGVFEREGSNLDDCGMVPREGDIAPGESLTVRFCGFLATVGAITAEELDFDFHAPCIACDAHVAVDDGPASSELIDAVAASVDELAAAGFGTADELGLAELDADRAGGDPASAPSEAPGGPESSDGAAPATVPPPPPPPSVEAVVPPTEPGLEGTGDGPFGDEVTIGDSVAPATTVAPTTTVVAAVDTGITLSADGLGAVDFDATSAETVGTLTELLGEPDESTPPVFEPLVGTIQAYRWGHLWVRLTGGNELYFSSYELTQELDTVLDEETDVYEFSLVPYEPADWEVGLATADGVSIGTTADEAQQIYQPVYAPRCDGPMEERQVTDVTGSFDQLFLGAEERGLYLREPIDGVVWAIGAQNGRNPLLCDGGVPTD